MVIASSLYDITRSYCVYQHDSHWVNFGLLWKRRESMCLNRQLVEPLEDKV